MNITKTWGRVRAHSFSHLLIQVTDYMLGHVIIKKICTKKETCFKSMFFCSSSWFDTNLGSFQPLVSLPDFWVQNHHAGLPVLFRHPGPGCTLATRRYRTALISSYVIILCFVLFFKEIPGRNMLHNREACFFLG